jgi:hypothetical protein
MNHLDTNDPTLSETLVTLALVIAVVLLVYAGC